MVGANDARSAELAIIISYSTSSSGINVLLNTPTNFTCKTSQLYLSKQPIFSLFLILSMTRTVTIFGEHGIMAHTTMMAKPIRALALHYPMIQILIIMFRTRSFCGPT